MPTRRCTDTDRRGRLAKARQFLAAAELVEVLADEDDGDEFRSDAVDDLPSSQGGTVVRRSADPSDGTVIAVATTSPPERSPDDARPTPIFALSGDKWVEGHPVPFAEGWFGVVLQSGTVVSFVPRGPLGNVELDLA